MKSRELSKRVEQALEMPDGLLSGEVRMQWSGSREVVVEGCCGILEYDDSLVRLDTRGGELRFRGSGLQMGCLNEDGTVIRGRLLSMEFLS